MKLLAIPNDPMSAYGRNYEEDFLGEFNPIDSNSKRIFDEVKFLNWKDEKISEKAGIKSYPLLKDKTKARKIMDELSSGSRKFISPLFKNIFMEEIKEIDKFVESYNPDVVRAFNTHFAAELGSIIRSRHNIPLVVSVHDPSRITKSIEEADSLVCISNYLKNKCLKEYSVSKDNITIIPDGIDMDFFYPRKNNEVGFNSKYKILSVGRIVPSKNIETLLESVSSFSMNNGGNVTHLHLGKGSEENKNKIFCLRDKKNLGGITYFLGGKQKKELPKYYSWADVYTLPTLWEGLGRAQIEALSCGTPVLTSNYPPMTEIVRDGYNGMIYDPKNHKQITEKIEKYFNDSILRKELEKNSRTSVFNKYNLKRVMEMNCRNYKKMVSKK